MQIECILFVKNEKEIAAIRNKYFDVPGRPSLPEKKPPCTVSDGSRFICDKRIVEGSKEYLSYAHWKKGLDRNNEVIDTPEYWRESDHFYIYESD